MGDTVYLLGWGGEGYRQIWYRGARGAVQARWVEPGNPDTVRSRIDGVLLALASARWWVRVRADDSREGWLDMQEAGGAVQIPGGCG